jgi:hypothetical protein
MSARSNVSETKRRKRAARPQWTSSPGCLLAWLWIDTSANRTAQNNRHTNYGSALKCWPF